MCTFMELQVNIVNYIEGGGPASVHVEELLQAIYSMVSKLNNWQCHCIKFGHNHVYFIHVHSTFEYRGMAPCTPQQGLPASSCDKAWHFMFSPPTSPANIIRRSLSAPHESYQHFTQATPAMSPSISLYVRGIIERPGLSRA